MTRPPLLLASLGAGIVLLVGAGGLAHPPGGFGNLSYGETYAYVAAALGAGVLYAAAVALVRGRAVRHGLPVVLACAALMRLLTVSLPPLLSTDVYRYVWDGRVQAAGINPYLHVPAAPELLALRDAGGGAEAVYPNINRAESAPTIYPPVAQGLFLLLARAWPGLWGMKAAMLAFDAAAMGALLLLLRAAGRPPAWVLAYAWNPLPVWEFGGAGHLDAAAAAFIALALLAAARRRMGWAGLALGAAVMVKLLPAAMAPALWRRWEWRAPLACGAVVAAGYAWYADAGWRVLGYLPGYADEEGVAGGGAFLLRLLALAGPVPPWAGTAYKVLAAVALLGLAAHVALRGALPADPAARAEALCRDALLLGTAVLVLLSPRYPWYFATLAVPAVLAPGRAVLYLTAGAPLLYFDFWRDQALWPALLYLPFAALAVFDARRPPRRLACPPP